MPSPNTPTEKFLLIVVCLEALHEVLTIPDNMPRVGDGWDDFLKDEDSVWYDAFETIIDEEGNEVLDVDHYDEYGNIQELVNFVAGTGSYEDTRSFVPGRDDIEDQKLEMNQAAGPKCPMCVEEVEEYLEQGAMRGEVDIDPRMELQFWVNEEDATYSEEHSKKYIGHGIAYCDNEDHRQVTFLSYEESWFGNEEE